MRLSFRSLGILADSGDESAKKAIHTWLTFIPFQSEKVLIQCIIGENTLNKYHISLKIK